MADALPSADEFFGPSTQQPGGQQQSADDFFAQKGSYSGAAHDAVWSSALYAPARVLNAFGYGAESHWGAEPIGLPPEAIDGLRKAGMFNDYTKGHASFVKTAGEATLRSAADLADILGQVTLANPLKTAQTAMHLVPIPLYAAGAALGQTAREIEPTGPAPEFGSMADIESPVRAARSFVAPLVGEAGEIAGAIPEGFLPEIGSPPHVAAAERARSIGAIGEGDAGFYDAEPVTPGNAHARAQAAEPDAPPVRTRPPPADVHELAARIDPVTMEEFQANLDRVNALMQGREITEGIAGFDAERLARATEAQRLQAEDAELEAQAKALPAGDAAAADRLARVRAVEESLKDETLDPATRRELSQRRDELLTDTTPEKLEAAAAPLEQARAIDAQRAQIADDLSRLEAQEASQRAEEIIGPKAADQQQAALIGARLALRDLAPKVEALYEQARDMAPDLPEETTSATVTPHEINVSRETIAGRGPVPTPVSAESGLRSETGRPSEATLPEVRVAGLGEAPRGLQPAAESGVVLPAVSHGGAQEHALREVRPTGSSGEGPALVPEVPGGLHAGTAEGTAAEGQSANPRPRPGTLKPVAGTGPLRTRGLSEGVEAKAVEAGLATNFGDLPEYRQVSMAEQAETATKLLDADPALAKDIALGRKQPPKGLLPESVFVAVEKRALADGDVETLRQLATQSRLATEATTMGQRLRTLGERDPTSPVAAIQSVQQAREAALARKGATVEQAKAAEVESMKAEVRKTAPKPDAFAAWLDEIKCEA